MRIVVAADSFKGTLSAFQACHAIAAGLREALPDADIIAVPMADGGEGTVDAVVTALAGELRITDVCDPLQRSVSARYGLVDTGKTAVIEMAEAAGLLRVAAHERDIMRATTFGVGQLIRHALEQGARRLLVAIGGSATNDGGCGMAQALGYRFLDATGRPLLDGIGGGDLPSIERIATDRVIAQLADATVEVLCDVANPLTGPNGAAYVYARQKGASDNQIEKLDESLAHLARIIERDLGLSVNDIPGAGAAGGLGAGLVAFAGAALVSGGERIIELVRLAEHGHGADAIITGEGRLDEQSLNGKVVSAVAALGKQLDIPVYAIAGRVELSAERWQHLLIDVAAVQSSDDAPIEAATALSARSAAAADAWFGHQ